MSSGTGGSHQVIRWPNRSAVLDGSGASALGQTLVPNADRCWPASAESDFSRAELRDDPDAFLARPPEQSSRRVVGAGFHTRFGQTALPQRTRRREGPRINRSASRLGVFAVEQFNCFCRCLFCVLLRAVPFCDLCVLLLLSTSRARGRIADRPTREQTDDAGVRYARARIMRIGAVRGASGVRPGVGGKGTRAGCLGGAGCSAARPTAERSVRHGLRNLRGPAVRSVPA